jgi:acyl carrier protein
MIEEGGKTMAASAFRDIEETLMTFPGMAEVTVDEHDTEPGGRQLVAYAATNGAEIDVLALNAHARERLSGDRIPAAIVVIDALPRTVEGLVDRQALPVPDLEGVAAYRAPTTARQKTLCSAFAEVLGVPRVGLDDDFFGLGGQSLEALLLSGRIGAALGVEVPMAELFDAPTIAELDRRLDALMSGAEAR